jgi:hypothetical protein
MRGVVARRCCLAVVLIGSPAAAAPDRPLGCAEITECCDRCSSACPAGVRRLACLLGCNRKCRRQGCPSALPLYDAVTSCIQKHCLRPCMSGPTPECRQCGGRHCQEPRQRCDAHRCGPGATCVELAPPVVRPDEAPTTQPAGLLTGTALQPGQRGYKSAAVATSASVAAALLPVVAGGFSTRSGPAAGLWVGLGLIAAGQTFGPSVGFWYAGERAPLTWYRLGVSLAALGTAGYPFYGYGGRLDHYDHDLAAGLLAATVVLETAAILLAAWDLSAIGEAVERHNRRPPARGGAALLPVALPGGGGLGLVGWLR